MVERLEIAVVGAGIAGLAAAALLAGGGHRVRLYERFETPAAVGAGLMLQPTGLAALSRLGLAEAMLALGHPIRRLAGVSVAGRVVFDLAYDGLGLDIHGLGVHRHALHGLLWRRFQASGAELECAVAVAGLETQAGGRPALRDEAGRLLPAADLVVDASGARSVLRRALGGAAPRPFPYGAIWATVPDPGLSDGALSQQYAQARIMIGYLPIGRQTAEGPPLAAFFWSLKPELYGAWHAGFEAWLDKAARLWPAMRPVLEGFSGPDDLSLASYAHYTARRPVKGRLVAIGDAGHSTSPQLGQGANNGLIDAVVLHDALARETDLDAALALFAKTRHGHVRFYQWASRLMTPYFQSDSVALSTLRDLTFARLKLVPYTHREMIRTLAGLKTGPFTWAPAERIVNALAAREASP